MPILLVCCTLWGALGYSVANPGGERTCSMFLGVGFLVVTEGSLDADVSPAGGVASGWFPRVGPCEGLGCGIDTARLGCC